VNLCASFSGAADARSRAISWPPRLRLTAHSIAQALTRFVLRGATYHELIVAGGGARNPTLLAMLANQLRILGLELHSSDEFGLPAEAKEAAAFALLAFETWNRRPSNMPAATGAEVARILGKVSYAVTTEAASPGEPPPRPAFVLRPCGGHQPPKTSLARPRSGARAAWLLLVVGLSFFLSTCSQKPGSRHAGHDHREQPHEPRPPPRNRRTIGTHRRTAV